MKTSDTARQRVSRYVRWQWIMAIHRVVDPRERVKKK